MLHSTEEEDETTGQSYAQIKVDKIMQASDQLLPVSGRDKESVHEMRPSTEQLSGFIATLMDNCTDTDCIVTKRLYMY